MTQPLLCPCGGHFVTEQITETWEDGAGSHSRSWTEDHCNKCGRELGDVAAEASRKTPLALAILALRPTGTEQH